MSSVFPYMCDSVQVPRGFSGIYIVKLLLHLQNRLFKIQRERLLCFLSNYVYQPNHLIKKVPYCEFAKTVTPLKQQLYVRIIHAENKHAPLGSQLRQLP